MTANDLWRLSASELSAKLQARELSATEVTADAVARLRAVNPALNAVVEDLGDAALVQAEALDAEVAGGAQPGPLHGVPVTVKVNVDQTGHATTNGVAAFKDIVAPDDAPLVRNLQNAGAVAIGRTNTPEFSFRADTDNPLYGRTENPWGRHISCGGSSGGAGAAVVAGIGALGHGNDIGGSLRFPAAANGAVTVKPGLGRVPAWNPSQKAERGMLAQSMSAQGLIARHAADLNLAMPTMIAPDPRDPFHVPLPWQGEPLSGPIPVAMTKTVFGADLHPDVDAALDSARDALVDAGYRVDAIEPPDVFAVGRDGYRALMGEVKALLGPDIQKYGSPTIHKVFELYFQEFPPLEDTELLEMLAKRSAYARDWSVFLDRYPLVLTPFLPHPYFGPNRDTESLDGMREALGCAVYSFAFNFMGLPAGCLPTRLADLDQGPQPIAVQLVGRRWREDLIVAAMEAIEARVGTFHDTLWDRMART